VSVIVNRTVGVYGICPWRGPGPWTETTRRVEGDDVSMYAEPGAVVIRLVRRTAISSESPKDEIYKCDEVRELVSLFVVLMLRHVWEIYVRISVAQDMMRGVLVFAFGRQPWSCLLCGCFFQLSVQKYENRFALKSRLSRQTRDLD
jgi:hypothetical protein